LKGFPISRSAAAVVESGRAGGDIQMEYKSTGEYFLVFSRLVEAARFRGTVTYQELADVMGLPITGNFMGDEIGNCLGEISEDQHALKKPMLSAVAVTVGGLPGAGFFIMAKKLGMYSGSENNEDRRAFWEKEVKLVYECWKRKFNP
jgi:hypothetical protein